MIYEIAIYMYVHFIGQYKSIVFELEHWAVENMLDLSSWQF